MKEMPQEQLVPGQWYEGEGRLGPLAKWAGNRFVAPDYSMGQWDLSSMEYGERGFSPYRRYGDGG